LKYWQEELEEINKMLLLWKEWFDV
jgi:hypothetical protein